MNPTCASRNRRGALLLLVLGFLTMFMLIGAVMLTLATRARTSSRAFAAATAGTATGPISARKQLEEALLQLLRGGANAKAAGLSESLLEDQYGFLPPLVADVTAIQDRGILVEATISPRSGTAAAIRAADLCGRVITFTPSASSADSIMSQRILRASAAASGTGAFTCWVAKLQSDPAARLPQAPCRAIINQPAFRDEAYDAYDQANPWLTQVALQDGSVASVPRPAFASSGAAASVDNDNDGIDDGVWLNGLLETRPAPDGGMLSFDVSYLVLDLDGRINVNAHGTRTSIDFGAANGGWDFAPAVPTGSGYGPADVDASLVFVNPLQSNATQTDPPLASDVWRRIVGDTAVGGLTALTSTTSQRRPVPLVGPVNGRYGMVAAPGISGTNDRMNERSDRLFVTGTAPLPTASSVIDLKSIVKVDMAQPSGAASSTSPVPELTYYCPDWSRSNYVDDPYEMRLDSDAPRPGQIRYSGTATELDNPFTAAELEATLRQFDSDAPTLPPRLAVALDHTSQRSRMLVTTDSWDTPGLTGSVAQEVADYVAALQCDPSTVMSPDVLAGLRFDINRPFPGDNTGTPENEEKVAKEEYCKHLYMLLVALGQPPSTSTAQWAANVVDYRDTDSTFTRFQFDTNPADGWGEGTNGWAAENLVWGLERPELVIAQTIAYYTNDTSGTTVVQDGLAISLYRPAFTEKLTTTGTLTGNKKGLVVTQTNMAPVLDLAEKSSQSSQPVWRLRIEPGTSVRFDKPGSSDKVVPGVFRNTGAAKDAAVVAPDSYLVVMPKPLKATGNSGTSAISVPVDSAFKRFEIDSGGTFKAGHWPGAASYQSGSDTIVFLERLEDPTKPWNETRTSAGYNPYVPLDRMGVKRVNRTGENANNWKTFIREHSVWNNGPFETTGNSAGIVQLNPTVKSWLPWPNRPFISQAELVLVSPGNGTSRYWDYKIPRDKKAANPYYDLPTPKLLDAAIVPSRFTGSQVTVDPTVLAPVGMSRVPFSQLSRWREPGRVNLNTIVSNTSCADPQRDNAVWWATLGPDAAVSLDDFKAAGPATSIGDLLTLMQGQGLYLDSAAAAGVKGNSWKKNRPYDLNPQAAYTTAIRLANVATVRSHVFAVWVTLRVRDGSPGGDDSYHRLFAIIDRSRPVGFSVGQDLNVRDTIRVLRFLE